MPPPPLTFSISTGWPSTSASRAPMMRAIRSSALPTPNGTTMVIGRAGKLCAEAAGAQNHRREQGQREHVR